MKNLILLYLSLLLISATVTAQPLVTEDVRFDYYQSLTDNDFVNHFSNGNGLTQILTNGITGGCLSSPDSINWGSFTDEATYCSKYKPATGDSAVTSICFKYDAAGVLPGSFQRAVSLWLIPYADFNHYIVASVSRTHKLELLTYSWNNSPYPNLALNHGNWYQIVLTAIFIGGVSNQVYLKAEVFDLGTSGTSLPSLVNSSSGTINDNIVAADTSIQVSFNGTLHGGAAYFDDFHFEGREGFTNCINTTVGIEDEVAAGMFSVYPSPAVNSIFIERNSSASESMHVSIYDMPGRKQEELSTKEKKTELNISFLPEGIYLLQCRTATQVWTTKITVNR